MVALEVNGIQTMGGLNITMPVRCDEYEMRERRGYEREVKLDPIGARRHRWNDAADFSKCLQA